MYDQALNSNSIICSTSISSFFFSRSILSGKNWRGGCELLKKDKKWILVRLSNLIISRAGFT